MFLMIKMNNEEYYFEDEIEAEDDPQFNGQVLLNKGFEDWFLFFFPIIESGEQLTFEEVMDYNNNDLKEFSFIVDPIHKKLFKAFEEVYNKQTKRKIIKIPPRSGKTTMLIYFIAFCLANRKDCQFIYISYSQELSRTSKDLLWRIINNPVYKEMYYVAPEQNEEDIELVKDRYWKDSYYKQSDNPDFRLKGTRITTAKGGNIMFTSLGGQITGFGAGKRRNTEDFLGCIFLDDPNKPDDMFSEHMQDKVYDYFSSTCLTRCNNSDTAIFIIQQTLGERDLSNIVIEKFKNKYSTTIEPLILEDGTCQIPSQYTQERIEELKMDNYLFQTQYQQNPIANEFAVIKKDFFLFYENDYTTLDLVNIFMTIDVAKAQNNGCDNTCICVWGLSRDKFIYLVDMIWNKIDPVNLEQNIINKYLEYSTQKLSNNSILQLSNIYIEKNGNEFLIPNLRKTLENIQNYDSNAELIILQRDAQFTKPKRCQAALKYLPKHIVYFPRNQKIDNEIMYKAISECEHFRLDMSHKHDDFCDNLFDAVLINYDNPGYLPNQDNFSIYSQIQW